MHSHNWVRIGQQREQRLRRGHIARIRQVGERVGYVGANVPNGIGQQREQRIHRPRHIRLDRVESNIGKTVRGARPDVLVRVV